MTFPKTIGLRKLGEETWGHRREVPEVPAFWVAESLKKPVNNVCLPVGQKAIFDVDVQVGTAQVEYALPAIAEGTFNGFGGGPCDNFAVSQQVRIYADPNTTVTLAVVRSDLTGSALFGVGSFRAYSEHAVILAINRDYNSSRSMGVKDFNS